MSVDGLLEGGRVVGLPVALDTQRVHVDPVGAGRQRADGGRQRRRQGRDRGGLVARVEPAPARVLPLSRKRAKTGTFEQTASSNPICVDGFFSLLTTTAARDTFSKRLSFTHT